MTTNFRQKAKALVTEAHTSLSAGDDASLRAAALSLRMAMEALTYERVKIYSGDLPPDDFKKWQPRQLLGKIVEIDPYADLSSTVSYGVEPELGKTPEKMTFLGEEQVLNLATVKKHYDALGSYLHIETLHKIESGTHHDMGKLRRRCEVIADAIDVALASPIWNVNFNTSSEIDCMECRKPIRRRFRSGSEPREVSCFDCGAEYQLSERDGKVHWEPFQREFGCPAKDCEDTMVLWRHEIIRGTNWTCSSCNTRYVLDLTIVPFDQSSFQSQQSEK